MASYSLAEVKFWRCALVATIILARMKTKFHSLLKQQLFVANSSRAYLLHYIILFLCSTFSQLLFKKQSSQPDAPESYSLQIFDVTQITSNLMKNFYISIFLSLRLLAIRRSCWIHWIITSASTSTASLFNFRYIITIIIITIIIIIIMC